MTTTVKTTTAFDKHGELAKLRQSKNWTALADLLRQHQGDPSIESYALGVVGQLYNSGNYRGWLQISSALTPAAAVFWLETMATRIIELDIPEISLAVEALDTRLQISDRDPSTPLCLLKAISKYPYCSEETRQEASAVIARYEGYKVSPHPVPSPLLAGRRLISA